ncbi:MAG: AAA family ATPase [Bacteroidota bacterium]|nr:AAA family ATPase [Bacteroidota bacterium]
MIDRLYDISNKLASNVAVDFERFLSIEIDWDYKLIGISGARGSGKTILLLQQMKKMLEKGKKSLFISLDDIYFTENKLLYFAEEFEKNGGEYLFIDEVHKYKNWSQELKNIYDTVLDLKVVFTSSSALEIHKGSHDLSRRALVYKLRGLSFREFLELKYEIKILPIKLEQILENPTEKIKEVNNKIKIFPKFSKYLKEGYYPFFKDLRLNYLKQLSTTVNLVIESDLPAIHKIDFNSVIKLKKLVSIIAQISPYKPNIEKLAQQVETTRPTLLKYLFYLDKAQILQWLSSDAYGITYLNKPDKIFLGNTNIAYAFSDSKDNTGNIRETFFLNQLSAKHKVTYPKQGDFLVDNKYLFEVGGKNKSQKQIAGIKNAYIAADDIEYGYGNRIPLWLFGFLY